MPLGVLYDLPGLQPAALDALHTRQQRALAALCDAVAALAHAAETLQEAAMSLGAQQDDDDDDALWWSKQPVFVSYTMQQLGA